MSAVVAIGDARRLAGYALAGATVVHAARPAAVDAAWDDLADDTVLVLLTHDAHERLARRLRDDDDRLWAVLPE